MQPSRALVRQLVAAIWVAATVVNLACADDGGSAAPDGATGADAGADAVRGEAGIARVPLEAQPLDLPAIELACQQYSAALCAKLEACAPKTFARDHGSAAACLAGTARACRESLTQPGQVMTLASLGSCTTAAQMFTCQTRPSLPPSCPAGRGNLVEGNPCRLTAQCKRTLYCRIPTGMECGLCHPPLPAGAECTPSDQCEPGGRCVLGNGQIGQCLGAVKLRGQACSPLDLCEPGSVCSAGVCAEPPRDPTIPLPPPPPPSPPASAGEDCSRASCDSRQDGLYCNRLTSKCEPMLPLAMAGQPCGNLVDGSGGIIYCAAGTSCIGRQGVTRTCEPDLAPGSPCQPALGPRCARPATCVAGTCQDRVPMCS